ncbi:MAG: class I SAM-dependent methyltransferase [Phycisphaeraceae bacterium]
MAGPPPHSPYPPHRAPEDWYARSFGELYPLLYQHRDDASAAAEAAAFLKLLKLPAAARVLDICCGTGRHLAAMCQQNLNAWGVDLSWPLLKSAAERPGLAGRVVRADLRALPFAGGSFDAAVNLFTSFGYFAEDAANEQALKQMASTLRPGGKLLMDLMHAPRLRETLEPHSRRTVQGPRGEVLVENRRQIIDQRVVNRIDVNDGTEQRTFTESVRLYEPAEFMTMLEAAGLRAVQLVGSFEGDPLTADSARMIAIGVRQ